MEGGNYISRNNDRHCVAAAKATSQNCRQICVYKGSTFSISTNYIAKETNHLSSRNEVSGLDKFFSTNYGTSKRMLVVAHPSRAVEEE